MESFPLVRVSPGSVWGEAVGSGVVLGQAPYPKTFPNTWGLYWPESLQATKKKEHPTSVGCAVYFYFMN